MIGSAFGVLFDGFAYGMLLFLLSVGLSVTLGMMNFVNLAHCSFAMLGGYVTVSLTNALGWPFPATLPLAFLSAAVGSVAFRAGSHRRPHPPPRSPPGPWAVRPAALCLPRRARSLWTTPRPCVAPRRPR